MDPDLVEDEVEDSEFGHDVDVKETLALQLSEVEMVQSMFGNPGEFQLDGMQAELEIQAFLGGTIEYQALESRIGFTVKISPQDCKNEVVELVCRLPHKYPCAPPEVYLRSTQMNRDDHSRLNEDLQAELHSLSRGELCMGRIIQWLQENIPSYLKNSLSQPSESKAAVPSWVDTKFTRLWVYSHHIFSKFKRRDILDWAQELKLSGFCMPGKPGVICVEGYHSAVEDFWYRLRNMNWKRIVVKEKEEMDITSTQTIDSLQKFSMFEEKIFDARGGRGREYHMDLGQFYDFLVEHGCDSVFSLFFGVEGRSSASNAQS